MVITPSLSAQVGSAVIAGVVTNGSSIVIDSVSVQPFASRIIMVCNPEFNPETVYGKPGILVKVPPSTLMLYTPVPAVVSETKISKAP